MAVILMARVITIVVVTRGSVLPDLRRRCYRFRLVQIILDVIIDRETRTLKKQFASQNNYRRR